MDWIIELVELAREEGAAGLAVESNGRTVDFWLAPSPDRYGQDAGAVGAAPVSLLQPDAATAAEPAEVGSVRPYYTVRAPWVGIFHRRLDVEDAPGREEVVARVGDEVVAETTLAGIESLKVMNEVQAEVRGILCEVLVDEGDPVEYGQPLFLIELAGNVGCGP